MMKTFAQFTVRFRKARIGLVVVSLILLALPMVARAGVDFCSTDPILLFDGKFQNIEVGVPYENIGHVKLVRVTAWLPDGKSRSIHLIDESLFLYKVTLNKGTRYDPNRTNYMKVTVDVDRIAGVGEFPVQLKLSNNLGTVIKVGTSAGAFTAYLPVN